ncbi:uncharacterized protein MYCFIDRAFT_178544 [Pseudocercospora fijiensis CIRAD86]|uniref:Uncharacterized protein n=1 Tax=Pseudocercospora fijiensis (strain CIRAD86) TaxID=383855 RepID=M3AMP7_PSEFD|nr:uncharacterized protein MYCFIDRAFT_178544 [Pseudocercospora fijiensis CIRAD86]EME78398.1 hypothetical protein MYCFIDRAFT_178544 [Pseudocercospora fijiensis CIRAD86]
MLKVDVQRKIESPAATWLPYAARGNHDVDDVETIDSVYRQRPRRRHRRRLAPRIGISYIKHPHCGTERQLEVSLQYALSWLPRAKEGKRHLPIGRIDGVPPSHHASPSFMSDLHAVLPWQKCTSSPASLLAVTFECNLQCPHTYTGLGTFGTTSEVVSMDNHLHKPLPKLPVRQHEWFLMETSLAPWNVDRAAPDVDEYRSTASDRDGAIGHALSALDLTNTEETHRTVVWQPAVTHATHVVQPYEITRQAVDRELHDYHYFHRTLPVTDFHILPSRHFVENGRGSYTEVSEENKPLDAEDETELLRVIDNSVSKERAEMIRVKAEPSPIPEKEKTSPRLGRDSQARHYLRHPTHASIGASEKSPQGQVHSAPTSTRTFRQAQILPSEDRRDSEHVQSTARTDSSRSMVARPGIPAIGAPVANTFPTGQDQHVALHQRNDSYPRPPVHMASRKTPFFQRQESAPMTSVERFLRADHRQNRESGLNMSLDNSISLTGRFTRNERSALEADEKRGPALRPPQTEHQGSERLCNSGHRLPSNTTGPERAATSGMARSAESAPSLTKPSAGHSWTSCSAPKLIRSPTTSGIRAAPTNDVHPISAATDVGGNTSRLPRPATAITKVPSGLPDPDSRTSTSTFQKPHVAPNNVPVVTSQAHSTEKSLLPAAYARAAGRTAYPSSRATAARITSQPTRTSQGMYLNYSNFHVCLRIKKLGKTASQL